jgi:hypothetical protein
MTIERVVSEPGECNHLGRRLRARGCLRYIPSMWKSAHQEALAAVETAQVELLGAQHKLEHDQAIDNRSEQRNAIAFVIRYSSRSVRLHGQLMMSARLNRSRPHRRLRRIARQLSQRKERLCRSALSCRLAVAARLRPGFGANTFEDLQGAHDIGIVGQGL